jgi:predicted adenylyl cyclase CyaB
MLHHLVKFGERLRLLAVSVSIRVHQCLSVVKLCCCGYASNLGANRTEREMQMARNIEIKAGIPTVESLLAKVGSLATSGPVTIHQDDTFFNCPSGRMKLRKLSDTDGEMIFYRRADRAGPKESFYVRVPTASPDLLRQALTLGYGVIGRVCKERTLFMVGRTRIHLDRVDDLGDFLELEVVLSENESTEKGLAEAQELLQKLQISADQLVSGAYVDLLAKCAASLPESGAR